MIWNQNSLSEALGVVVNFPVCCNQVQFNSSDVKDGDLFIALKGQGDGHDYVMHALERGASVVIVERTMPCIPANRVICVQNSAVALRAMAMYKRKKSAAKFIAITGSVGKTSVKDALKTIFTVFTANTFASRYNFNNYLGVLLNLASMPDDIKYAIFELGMSGAGELRELTKLVMPIVAIITNISEAHLVHFQNVTEIVTAKCEIFEGLSEGGTAIVNTDNDYKSLISSILHDISISNIYFGGTDDADFQLTSYKNLGDRVLLNYKLNNNRIDVTLPFIPRHCAINYAIILIVVLIFGESLEEALKQLSGVKITAGRGEVITIGSNQIICDYYNASPASMKASLRYLQQLPGDRKVAILGDMLELGERSRQLHQDLVPYILESGCSKVFLVGPNTKYIYDMLADRYVTRVHFTKVDDLIRELPTFIEKDEIILVKGSRGIRLDLVINCYKKYEHAI